MKKLVALFLLSTCPAFADGVCEYNRIANELRNNCSGINKELQEIKNYSIANTVVTGVGTVAAGGALYAGIKKKDLDKKAEELAKELDNISDMSDEDFIKFLKAMANYEELRSEYNAMCKEKHDLQAEAKKLGNIRTGLMAGNTATAIAGTILSSKNKEDAASIGDMIQQCLDTIQKNEHAIGQMYFDCDGFMVEKIKKAVGVCSSMNTNNMQDVVKHNQISTVVSGINIGTGAAGTITSAMGNSTKYDEKHKNLNTAANILAGTSMVASGVSTIFNATTIKSINYNIEMSAKCEEAIDTL